MSQSQTAGRGDGLTYPFLSDEWIDAARAIRDERRKGLAPFPHLLKINLVITEAPGQDEIRAHIDSSDGDLDIELGALAAPEVTVTTDFATAKALFVDQNPNVAMQAFMSGKIKVQGDMTKLLLIIQNGPSGDVAAQLASQIAADIKAITAP